jgi:hypothetical protein
MGDKRRCIFRAKSSDLSAVKQPWNLSNAQTSAPISYEGVPLEKQDELQRQRDKEEKQAHISTIRENMTMSMASLSGSSFMTTPSIV